MIIIKNFKNIESALKRYKSKIIQTKQLQKLKEREEYVKPSVEKRNKIAKAKYVQSLKDGLEN